MRLIGIHKIASVPNQVDDEDDPIQYHDYEKYKDKPLPVVNWSEEIVDLNQLNAPVLRYSKLWVKRKIL